MINHEKETLKEEIKQLLIKQLFGTLSPAESKQLEEWKSRRSGNEQLAQTLLSTSFIEKAITDSSRKDAEDSWRLLKRRMNYRALRRNRLFYLRAIAATILLLFMMAGGYYYLKSPETYVLHAGAEKAFFYSPNGECFEITDHLSYNFYLQKEKKRKELNISPNLYHTIATPRGGEYKLKLDDGSSIHLNAQSSLTIPAAFSKQNRLVNLAGEAYFEIKSDKSHPFTVQTSRAAIKVLGTRFCVKNYRDDKALLVTLEEGEVEINSAFETAHLIPGVQAIVDENGQITTHQVDTYPYCAWNQQRIAYNNESLVNILTDLGRWYDFEAAYSSDRLRNLRFSMDIEKSADFNDIAKLIEKTDKIQIGIKKNKVIVREL